jgi:hypothetical protein
MRIDWVVLVVFDFIVMLHGVVVDSYKMVKKPLAERVQHCDAAVLLIDCRSKI